MIAEKEALPMTTLSKQFSELDAFLNQKTHRDNHRDEAPRKFSAGPPSMPAVKRMEDEGKLKSYWKTVRAFYRTGKGGGIAQDLMPAHLTVYRDLRRLRYDYPVWISDEFGTSERHVISLPSLLKDAVLAFAPESMDAKILKDNLGRLELIVRKAVEGKDVPLSFDDVIGHALRELEEQLHIKGQEGELFSKHINQLRDTLPRQGRLVGFSQKAPFYLMSAALHEHQNRYGKSLSDEAGQLRSKLNDILQVEYQKRPDAKKPEKLQDAYGYGASFINFDKFSGVMPESATESMSAERLKRIEETVEILRSTDLGKNAVLLLAHDLNPHVPWKWDEIFPKSDIRSIDKENICSSAQILFEEHMRKVSGLMAAIRIARLELADQYEPEIHDDYFKTFDWQSFTDEEYDRCPPVILVVSVEDVMSRELADFSSMLASHRPIKTVVVKQDAQFDYRLRDQNLKFSFQQELGALAVSHRNTTVIQSTAIQPDKLFGGYVSGLSASSPSVFYVLAPKAMTDVEPYVWTGAALESRMFPEFSYDQKKGIQWGSRFDIEENPQNDKDWPTYPITVQEDSGQPFAFDLCFTFADFAAQDPLFLNQFMVIPPEYWTDDLVLFSEYLKLPATEAYSKVPYIWMVDQNNVLQKIATTHFISLFGQERLDFWHFIQEFGGVNSYHVQRAVARTKTELSEQQAEEIAKLEKAYENRIEEVRQRTAGEAMEKLSAILLDLDTLGSLPAIGTKKAATPIAAAPVQVEAKMPEAPKAEADEELTISAEAWLETIRCTSCNECININPNCFKYDANKQAVIADVKAATFLQLVTAAEKCPAKCIHPGQPLDSNEPGLDDLIKRADVFN